MHIDLNEAIRIHARVSRTRYGRGAKKRALKTAEVLRRNGDHAGAAVLAGSLPGWLEAGPRVFTPPAPWGALPFLDQICGCNQGFYLIVALEQS